MAYTPKKTKLQINYKVAIPFAMLLFLVVYFFVNVLSPKHEVAQQKFAICEFNNEKTKKVVEKTYENTYLFQDHLYYGDSLALFTQPYDGSLSDEMSGKSLILKNVCTKKEFAFVLDKGLDRKIMLNALDVGFYEMFIIEDLKEKRLISSVELDEMFMTTKSVSENKNIEVRLLANKAILKDYNVVLPHNYAFLDVYEKKQKEDVYDVIIDPSGSDTNFTQTPSLGSKGFGMNEATESMIAAEKLKASLEAKGFQTLIIRKADEVIDTYGEDGRLSRAYKAKGKYYIQLGFNEDETSIRSGVDVVYSAHASKVLSSQIMYDFSKNTQLTGSTVYMGPFDEPGIIQSKLSLSKLDGRDIYDTEIAIREAGGKATQAGMYSQNAIEGTSSFAKDNLKGMYAIRISFGYLTSEKDAMYWKNNQDVIVESLSNSITIYLGVE